MRKWVIFSSLAVLIVASITVVVYLQAIEPKKQAYKETVAIAKREGHLVTIDDFYLYNGMETYYVAVGENSKGKKKIVWIPQKNHKDTIIKNYSDGKSKKEIINLVNKEINPKKIISIKLGMEKDVPLWEVTYKSGSNHLNYEYFDFKTGEWLKYYRSI